MSTGPLKSLNGFVPFPSNNFWNTDISNAPVDPKSANYINYIGSATPLHPDFGAGLYGGQSIGIPYQIEAAAQPGVRVKLGAYASESGPGPAPIPANALIEGYPSPAARTRLRSGTCWRTNSVRIPGLRQTRQVFRFSWD